MEPNQEVPPVTPLEQVDSVEENQSSNMEAVSEQHVVVTPKSHKGPAIVIGVFIVLAVAGWGAYTAYASPSRVWQKFTERAVAPTVVSGDYNFSYQDNGSLSGDAANNPTAAIFTKVKFSANGTSYANTTDSTHPQATVTMNYSVASGNSSFGSSAQIIFLDQNFYINPGDNPIIQSALSALSPDQKTTWIKFDSKEAQSLAQAKASGTPAQLDYSMQIKIYKDIFQKHASKLIGAGTYIDKQTVHGVQTDHYSNKVNKEEIKSLASDVTKAMLTQITANGQITAADVTQAKAITAKVVNNFVDKLQISTFETWIGTMDFRLHKIKFASNAPSLASVFSAVSDQTTMNESDPQKMTNLLLNKITFNAQFSEDEEMYDFGKIIKVDAPADSIDILKKVREQQSIQEQMPLSQPLPAPIK